MTEKRTSGRRVGKQLPTEDQKVSVLLAEDHTIVREGMKALLKNEELIDIIGEASNGKETVALAKELDPDIVVMDISMPLLNGLQATSQIKRANPRTKILALTMYMNEEYVVQMLKAGASGYLLKKSAVADLVSAIKAVQRGDAFFSPSISSVFLKNYLQRVNEEDEGLDLLTAREKEVLQLIAEGYTNRRIAEHLDLSVKTVNIHRTNIMAKLDIHNVAGLVRYAMQKGWITVE